MISARTVLNQLGIIRLTDDEIVVRQTPPRDPPLDHPEEHDHHIRSQQFRADQDDQAESDGEDESFDQSQQTGLRFQRGKLGVVVIIDQRRSSDNCHGHATYVVLIG